MIDSRDLETRTTLLAKGANYALDKYNKAYDLYPELTSYSTSMIAVVGGDFVAKQVIEKGDYNLKDLAFTVSASLIYNYLAPKMITWSKKLAKKIKNDSPNWTATKLLLGMYYPLNFAYWNALSIKNDVQVNSENIVEGLVVTGLMILPYIPVDYFAVKKLSNKQNERYIRPFYAAIELVWNILFAGGNYIAKRT